MRIIVADANQNFRNVLVAILRDEGHETDGVALGGELVANAKASAPDVIIAHVRFPDIDALEALDLLRASGARVPVILTTGDLRVVSMVEAERLGVIAVLEKPFTVEQLRRILNGLKR